MTDDFDDNAVFGEATAYVPCDELAAALPAPDDDENAITGRNAGYVAKDQAPGALPASELDDNAVYGTAVGFVAKPCEECIGGCSGALGIDLGPAGTTWEVLGLDIQSTVDNDGSDHGSGAAHDETVFGPSFARMTATPVIGTIITDFYLGPSPFSGDPFFVGEEGGRTFVSYVKPSFPAVPTHWPWLKFLGEIQVSTPTLGEESAIGNVEWELYAVHYNGDDLQALEGSGGRAAFDLVDYAPQLIASGTHTSGYGVGEPLTVTWAADESKDRVALFIKAVGNKVAAGSPTGPQWVDRYPSYPSFTYFGGGIIVTAPGDLFACLSC
jgi:hypothetical protein